MKNIAVINQSYDDSSIGKIADGLHQHLLSLNYNSFLLYGCGDEPKDPTYVKFENEFERYIHALATRITGRQGCYSYFATKRLIRKLEELKIDTIYGVCLHGYYLNERLLFECISKRGIKFIYVIIDEYPYLGKCWSSNGCTRYLSGCGNCPQKKVYPASFFLDGSRHIYNNKATWYPRMKDCVFAGPEFSIKNAIKSPLMKGIRLEIIDEGIDIDFYSYREPENLRKKLGISNDKIIIFSTASFRLKNGAFYVELARRLENNPQYVFVHSGNKEAPENMPSNYIFVGFVPADELPTYYSLADLFVFTSMQDCMPNTCLESLACGTPIVCFDISGMSFLAGPDLEYFVKPGDIDDLERVVVKHAQKKNVLLSNKCREYAVDRYDRKKYFQKLLDCAAY